MNPSAPASSLGGRDRASSWASSVGVRRSMQANRGHDTRPEQRLRSALHGRGFRFRKNLRLDLARIRANVDIVFPGARVAVFVDGCFWHRCPEHATDPKLNGQFWAEKLARNVARDHQVNAALEEEGWNVVRVWEHQPLGEMIGMVEGALASTRVA